MTVSAVAVAPTSEPTELDLRIQSGANVGVTPSILA
jgi:hypothetical protein